MSIASPSSADYTTTINTIRSHLGNGTSMSAYEMRLALAVLKNAVSSISAWSTASTNAQTHIAAQLVILQAKGTNDASAEIDTADTVLTADAAALLAATPTVPTYNTDTVADG